MGIQVLITNKVNDFFHEESKVSSTQSLTVNPISSITNPFIDYMYEDEKTVNEIDQYEKSLWVYICIRKISQSLARVPLQVFRRKSKIGTKGLTRNQIKEIRSISKGTLPSTSEYFVSGKTLSKFPIDILLKTDAIEEATDSDLERLLSKPNPFVTKYWLMEGIITYLELRGNSFIEMVGERDEPISERNPPVELWHLNPDNMHIIPDKKEYIKMYAFEFNGQVMGIPKENIVHSKYFNPTDTYRGQSTIEALSKTIIQNRNSVDYQSKFFKNGMRPSGVISTDQLLGDMQFDRLKKQFETSYTGLRGMHKPLILEAGLNWENIGMTQRDADFIESIKLNIEDFLAAFGVPPILVGKPSINKATAIEQKQVFYSDTIQPKAQLQEEIINCTISPLFGSEYFVKFDWSATPLGQVDKQVMSEIIKTGMGLGLLSQNEGRFNLQKLGIDYGDADTNIGERGNILYISAGMVPVTDTQGADLREDVDGEDAGVDENEDVE